MSNLKNKLKSQTAKLAACSSRYRIEINLFRPGGEEPYLVTSRGLSTETKRDKDKTENTMPLRGRWTETNMEDSSRNTSQESHFVVEAYPATKTYFPSF